MKPKILKAPGLKARVGGGGNVVLSYGRVTVGVITPEIFTEGWAKNTAKATQARKFQGRVKLKRGSIGLRVTLKVVGKGMEVRAVLIPLEDVKVIHVRQVLNLPYGEWAGCVYNSGKEKGVIPVEPRPQNKIWEGKSAGLSLGPCLALDGKRLKIKAPGLTLALQDNRQWTPFLHAFATGPEKSEPAWVWKKGKEKVNRMVLTLV